MHFSHLLPLAPCPYKIEDYQMMSDEYRPYSHLIAPYLQKLRKHNYNNNLFRKSLIVAPDTNKGMIE